MKKNYLCELLKRTSIDVRNDCTTLWGLSVCINVCFLLSNAFPLQLLICKPNSSRWLAFKGPFIHTLTSPVWYWNTLHQEMSQFAHFAGKTSLNLQREECAAKNKAETRCNRRINKPKAPDGLKTFPTLFRQQTFSLLESGGKWGQLYLIGVSACTD